MTCEARERDILLLAHGELAAWRRVLLEAHLRRCEACRRTLSEMRSVSRTLSNVLCDPALAAWSPEAGFIGAPPRTVAGWSPAAVRILCVAALIVALLIAGITLRGRTTQRQRSSLPIEQRRDTDLPCRPGLPHDRCR